MAEKQKNESDILNFLLEKGEKKETGIVLFENSRFLAEFNSRMAKEVRESGAVKLDSNTVFRITNKKIEVGNKSIILGLTSIANSLVNGYDSSFVSTIK